MLYINLTKNKCALSQWCWRFWDFKKHLDIIHSWWLNYIY